MNKKFISILMASAIVFTASAVPQLRRPYAEASGAAETVSYTYSAGDKKTYTREMEKLNRGLTVISTGSGTFLSWRLLDSEDAHFGSAQSNVSFNVYRNNIKIAEVKSATNYTDTAEGSSYSVAPVINGVEGEKCEAVTADIFSGGNNFGYFDIPLEKPAPQSLPKMVTVNKWNYFLDQDGNQLGDFRDAAVQWTDYNYTVGDCSAGDLDGDGEYEIIIKWDCAAQDNSFNGVTGNVYLDAYKLDGTRLWDEPINLEKNIRAGAHYTQFLVYDFDLDGKAEITAKTAPGSKDASGTFVTEASAIEDIKNADNSADYRNGGGFVLDGDEYLTIFDGETGAALDTIYYPNQRIDVLIWGDDYGNRLDRYTASVAYIDGERPYAFYMRGYYMKGSKGTDQRQAACAVSFDGTRLNCKYSFDTYNPDSYRNKNGSASYSNGVYKGVNGYSDGNGKYVGNGNHNCTVADVDNDGKDEVITGALCYELTQNDTLGVKWCTFMEHGDALHIGDYDPVHDGLEFFTVHEDSGPNTMSGESVEINYGMSVIDPDSGDILFHEGASADTGRGVMANVGMGGFYQIWSAKNDNLYKADGGNQFTAGSKSGLSQNFRVFWDGDLYDELLDSTTVTSWNGSGMSSIFTASGCSSINGTKANPALQADLLGDWREELVYPTADNSNLRVFISTIPTDYKVKTLMHDPVYRSGVAAEQTAYNQPPHIGFYLAESSFDPEVERIEITTLPTKTKYKTGEELDTAGLTVTAYFETADPKSVTGYSLSGYDPNKTGEQTVMVNYLGKTAEFKVKVVDVSISAIEGAYETASSSADDIAIGSYEGNFTIKHTVTINSMPADGSTDKNSTAGFLIKFNADSGQGGGWYLASDGSGGANVIWKNTRTYPVVSIETGKAYTFVYQFTNVGNGSGAAVKLTIYDGDTIVGEQENLGLRNMTEQTAQKNMPLTRVLIYNQAKTGEMASVAIDNAMLYTGARPTPEPTPSPSPSPTPSPTPQPTPAPETFVVNARGVLTEYNGKDDKVIIPSEVNGITVTEIGELVFANINAGHVTSVTLPETVKIIGANAFYGSHLETINLENVEKIEELAFYDSWLSGVLDVRNVTELGRSVFNCCHEPTIQLEKLRVFNTTAIGYDDSFVNVEIFNRDMIIEGQPNGIGFLYGYPGSAAEKYALENDARFIPLLEIYGSDEIRVINNSTIDIPAQLFIADYNDGGTLKKVIKKDIVLTKGSYKADTSGFENPAVYLWDENMAIMADCYKQ